MTFWLELTSIWQELDLMIEVEWSSSRDATRCREQIENERVFQFLAGLYQSLDDVRGRILSRTLLPSTRELFSEVRHEAPRRKVMLPRASTPASSLDFAALVSKSSDSNQKG